MTFNLKPVAEGLGLKQGRAFLFLFYSSTFHREYSLWLDSSEGLGASRLLCTDPCYCTELGLFSRHKNSFFLYFGHCPSHTFWALPLSHFWHKNSWKMINKRTFIKPVSRAHVKIVDFFCFIFHRNWNKKEAFKKIFNFKWSCWLKYTTKNILYGPLIGPILKTDKDRTNKQQGFFSLPQSIEQNKW